MNKAYKFRLYPNNEQTALLAKTFGCTRFIYNKMLGDKIAHYTATKTKLSNTPAQYKAEFPWLKEVDSLALANAQMNLQAAYNNFFRSPKVGFPKFKAKHHNRDSYTTNLVGSNIKLLPGFVVLPKMGPVRMKQHRVIPADYQLKAATVSKTPSGKYYASLLFYYEQEVAPIDPKTMLGLDFAMQELYVASDGSSACYPRFYRQAMEHLAREQRKLSKCTKGSSNRNKQRLKVARIHEKIANQRKDFLHKLSRQISNAYDAVCIEDLDMRAMSQALHFGKSVADNGWGSFTRMLAYKLQEQGKPLIKIDKWFPSSKTCSCCGNVKTTLALSERVYHCENCGSSIDRDYNASLNIVAQGRILIEKMRTAA